MAIAASASNRHNHANEPTIRIMSTTDTPKRLDFFEP